MLLDSSTNQYGISLAQATDEDLGFDVSFDRDWTVDAVKKAEAAKFGKDGPPPGTIPRVSLNPKTLARVKAQREAIEREDL